MDQQLAIDMCRGAIWLGLLISLPILVSGVLIGLMLGLFQALTQIQEQTIAIVLKIVVMILVGSLLLPWMTQMMIEYSTDLLESISTILTPTL
ncbi:MAG: flagellar biosynthetic protein FliQ [Thermoguttaceae bacterium]